MWKKSQEMFGFVRQEELGKRLRVVDARGKRMSESDYSKQKLIADAASKQERE